MFLMIRYSRLIGFDNNSFHPDDGEPTFNGNSRSIAFPTTEPLRTIRLTSNEKVISVKSFLIKLDYYIVLLLFVNIRKIVQIYLVHQLPHLFNQHH
jgi:hypothetical protein